MNTNTTLAKLETALIFLLAAAIFLSKPLIYLSILMLTGVTLARIATDHGYRHLLFQNKLFWASSGVFVLGMLSTVIGSGYAEDIGWMINKTMLLPMVIPLVVAFAQKTNRTGAIAGAVVGFWIAFLLTGQLHNWTWNGGRLEGATWLVDTWGVICAMLIVLLTPMLFVATDHKLWRCIIFVTLLAALIMLVTTGARGPWLGVLAGGFFYLAFRQRMALLVVVILGLASVLASNSIWPQQVGALKQRAISITNTQTDASNYIRLALWETGFALLTKQLVTGDKGFWFGYEKKGKGNLPNNFYYNEFMNEAKIKPGVLKEHNWKLTDFHNSYLESVFRNGILWTVGSLFILAWLAVGPLQRGGAWSNAWVAAPSLIGFLVIGMTYTLLPHFAFLFLIFFMALGRGFDR